MSAPGRGTSLRDHTLLWKGALEKKTNREMNEQTILQRNPPTLRPEAMPLPSTFNYYADLDAVCVLSPKDYQLSPAGYPGLAEKCVKGDIDDEGKMYERFSSPLCSAFAFC